MERLYSWYLEK